MKGQVLLLDVGSASVGACIAEKEADGRVVLSHSERVPLQNVSGANMAAIVTLALDALKKSLEEMRAAALSPERAQVFLAAPWYKANVVSISSQSEKPLKIGQGTVEKALADYSAKYDASSSPSTARIESVVTDRYVNGYATTLEKPVSGQSLTIELYESEADVPFIRNIEEIVRSVFPGLIVSFHSFPLAAFAVLRALREEESFVIMDVGGEITDISIVRRGAVAFTGSFPVGSLSLLRTIAGKGSSADAASRLSLFARGDLSAEETAMFSDAFSKAAAPWQEGYRALLKSALADTPLPNTTFLFAGKEELSWFEHILKDAAAPVHPVLMIPDFFESSLRLGDTGAYDSFLSTAGLYALSISQRYT